MEIPKTEYAIGEKKRFLHFSVLAAFLKGKGYKKTQQTSMCVQLLVYENKRVMRGEKSLPIYKHEYGILTYLSKLMEPPLL